MGSIFAYRYAAVVEVDMGYSGGRSSEEGVSFVRKEVYKVGNPHE
jgi:hypothetical protein